MKIEYSEFVRTGTHGGMLNQTQFACITEKTTTGHFWWKKTKVERKTIAKSHINWFFLDSGKYTPNLEIESLEKAYDAQEIYKKINFREDK